jgi:hypothetical protein
MLLLPQMQLGVQAEKLAIFIAYSHLKKVVTIESIYQEFSSG